MTRPLPGHRHKPPLFLVMKNKRAQQQFSHLTKVHQGIMDGDKMAVIELLPATAPANE